jgi:hypothetical protein
LHNSEEGNDHIPMTTTQSAQPKMPKTGQAQHNVASINITDQTPNLADDTQ